MFVKTKNAKIVLYIEDSSSGMGLIVKFVINSTCGNYHWLESQHSSRLDSDQVIFVKLLICNDDQQGFL